MSDGKASKRGLAKEATSLRQRRNKGTYNKGTNKTRNQLYPSNKGVDPSKGRWRDVKIDVHSTGLTDSKVVRSCGVSQMLVTSAMA